MKHLFSIFAAALGLSLLSGCTTTGPASTSSHQEHQVRANNLQTLNAGRAPTLPGD